MTKKQEIITRQLIDRACNARDSKGQRTIDFIPNAHSVMEERENDFLKLHIYRKEAK